MPSVMGPVNIASVAATLVMLQLFFRRNIPATYDFATRKAPRENISDARTFKPAGLFSFCCWSALSLLTPLAYRSACWQRWRHLFSGLLPAKDT